MYPATNGWGFLLLSSYTGVLLNGIDTAIFDLLHDAHILGKTILDSIITIEKNNLAGSRLIAVVLP